jgi:hypothetical protein
MTQADLQILTWQDAREDVKQVNPELASIIDNINPDDSYKLYRVRYPFGAMICTEGTVNVPSQSHGIVPITHPVVPNEIREDLTYRVIPTGLMLKKAGELHFNTKDRFIPLTVFPEGRLFGLWESLDPICSYFLKSSWNVSSGVRSIFMLPKISEASGYKRLQKTFGIRLNAPKQLKDQWLIFKKIANSPGFSSPWFSEVLFFSKKWFSKLDDNDAWRILKNYFYEISWNQSIYWRFYVLFELIRQQFAEIAKQENIKYGTYQFETLKHLITVGVGALPCFTANNKNDLVAPITKLQEVFADIYELEYIPTIMFPWHLNMNGEKECGYYSINEPTLIESVPRTREILSIMQTTRDIKELFENFKHAVMTNALEIENTPIYNLINNTNFEFIHTTPDASGHLKTSNKLPESDPTLINVAKKYSAKHFCSTSNFLRGCVRIDIESQ